MPTSKKPEKEMKEEKTQILIEMTASFSNEYLDEDYKEHLFSERITGRFSTCKFCTYCRN